MDATTDRMGHAGVSGFSRLDVWADVGTVMEHLQTIEWRMEGLEK